MKKIILLILLMFSISIENHSQSQNTINQSFEIFANDHFQVLNDNSTYFISTDKDEWETFCLKLNNTEYFKNKKIYFQIIVSDNINLKIATNSDISIYESNLNFGLNYIEIDLSKYNLDSDKDILLYFHLQNGEKWKGSLSLKPLYNSLQTNINKLNVFPNPCNEEFMINCEEQKGNLLIINSNGNVVENINIDLNNSIRPNLPSGNYVLLFSTENKQYSTNINIIK